MQQRLPKKIVVFCLPGIGDAILFTPALALLRRALPAAWITVVTMFRGTADILETNPDVDEVRCFDFFRATKWQGLRYVWDLRREGFDISIMPFPSNRLEYNVVNWLVGHRWRAAHRYQHQSGQNLWFLNNIVVTEDGHRHNVEENLRLVRAICEQLKISVPDVPHPELKLVLTAEDEQYGESFLSQHGINRETILFGFHTFSSTFKNMHRKCWGKDDFVQLIRRLGEQYANARFLIFSGPSDEEVNRYITERVDGRVTLVRESNLRQALALVKRSRVFIGNDSGFTHLSAAMGVPIVALYGPTNWRRLHPRTSRYVVAHGDLPCIPCFYYSSRPLRCVANLDYACMRQITVEQVLTAIHTVLSKPHEPTSPA